MKRFVHLRHALGPMGVAALLMIVAAAAFSMYVVKPLESRNAVLKSSIKRAPAQQSGAAGDKVEAVYSFLRTREEPTDWLAKLHGIGRATGVQMHSASYKTQKEGRVERYEIVLPLSGSYPQIRDFLKRSLADIPVLSLDQMSLKRESRSDGLVHAELRLTLHRVKS